ncbi:MAG: helix-turn-helix domain-containing protein [Methylovulum sp.]|nr:helix-turn-helix domain-containing protein [Methylovulum sp.]
MEITNKNNSIPLSVYVKQSMEIYFSQLSDHDAVNLHALVISEVEKPLLEVALAHSGYNQTKTAKVLGLSRSTLRKKLELYGIS